LIFNYHIDRDEIEKVQGLTSKYYEYYQKCYDDENYLTYYMDIARFLFSNKDFSQAANYYNNVRKSSKEKISLLSLPRLHITKQLVILCLETMKEHMKLL